MNEKNRINEEELESVSGGAIFYAEGISGSDPANKWEVVNDKGEVLDRTDSKEKAIWLAGKNNVNFDEVTWEDLRKMRGEI